MAFMDPQAVIPLLSLLPGDQVADFGGGSGAYTLGLARAVGAAGRVYIIDIQNELLERAANQAIAAGFENVEVVWGDLERPAGSKLKDESMNAVLLANTLFQTDARYQVALEAKRVLRPDGRVLVVEWTDSFKGLGPAAMTVVKSEDIKTMFAEAGMTLSREAELGDHHHTYLFTKA
jgi:ubiquinone/menaquinone biosynthesis C-methylase UbiE